MSAAWTTTPVQTAVVELRGVSVEYSSVAGAVRALSDVELTLAAGGSTAVVGRSGSGKSTLISLLALLRRPTRGTVLIDGREISTLSDQELSRLRSQRVGIVFQSFHLEPSLTAAENAMLSWFFADRSDRRLSRSAAVAHASQILDRLGVGELARRRPTAMSGGQRQRIAIARALFPGPGLLVADEPTGNLDEETANEVADVLLGLPTELGTTVVIVTHDATVAARAQRSLEIVGGRVGAVAGAGSASAGL